MLSKSRFTAGIQCAKQLWWRVHDRDAPELIPDAAQQHVFDRGTAVGEVARRYVSGGRLIPSDIPVSDRLGTTRQALDDGATVIYEAAFVADDVYVAVDILSFEAGVGWVVTEVKSSTKVKDEHLPDVAVQLYVLERCGLAIGRAEVMHLNRACRFPKLDDLFVRADVTERARVRMATVADEVAELKAALQGELPDVAPGLHCRKPYPCPFLSRCEPEAPKDHVSTLHGFGPVRCEKMRARGVERVHELPPDVKLSQEAQRQCAAISRNEMIVEPELMAALAPLAPPVAYLDFETVNPPIPVWDGCRPYDQIPVQFSCHIERADGSVTHHEWLAEPGTDPRPELARRLVDACAGIPIVLAYNSRFEAGAIQHLAAAAPAHAAALNEIETRLVDLCPVVRDHVYHPDFGGSFSLKPVIASLLPELGYGELDIGDGLTAAAALEDLLCRADEGVSAEQVRTRRVALLQYCARDTLVMQRLRQYLIELGRRGEAAGALSRAP